MKGIDNNSMFKYKGGSAAGKAPAGPAGPVKSFVSVQVNVYQYNTSTRQNVNQGNFTLDVKSQSQQLTLTIYRAGAQPLTSFNLTRTINWNLKDGVNVYITDPKGGQWTFQFKDALSAAQTTAVVGVLLSVSSTREIAFYEPSNAKTKSDRPVSLGDTVKVSYFAFTFSTFPSIDNCFSQNDSFITPIARDQIAAGWAAGIQGMSVGKYRAIFVPAQYTGFDNGQRDPAFPNAPIVIVTTLLRARFKDEPHGGFSQSETSDAPESGQRKRRKSKAAAPSHPVRPAEPAPPPPAPEPEPEPEEETVPHLTPLSESANQTQSETDHTEPENEQEEQQAEPEEEIDPEEAARIRKMELIRRMGGVASPFGMPILPTAARRESRTSSAAAPPKPEPEHKHETIPEPIKEEETPKQTAPAANSKPMTEIQKRAAAFANHPIDSMPVRPAAARRTSEKYNNIDEAVASAAQHAPVQSQNDSDSVSSSSRRSSLSTTEIVQQPVHASPQVHATTHQQAYTPVKGSVEQRLDNLEENISQKLDFLTGDVESDNVIRGVTSMVTQLKTKQREIDSLRRQLEESKSKTNNSPQLTKQLEGLQSENEDLKKRNTTLERRLKDAETRAKTLSQDTSENQNAAKKKSTAIVKTLMSNVFDEMNTMFDANQKYSGSDVSEQLYNLLRKHSFTALEDINQKGLF